MSGATIGGVVGGVIGAYFGNPQLGYMIGSAIGGYVDPEQVEGPRLTDATQQTAQDGVPRAYGYGRFPTTGNLIWTDELKERRNKQRAKGGSTEQVTYTYTRSYAIAVCRGPISGFLIIKRNGKIVFDARTDAELTALGFTSNQIAESRAAQAKFLQHVTLYYGGTDQTPDPTMTAVKGAGNVPGYIGTAYIVVTDDDLTDMRGAVPQYEFVVAACGERHEDSSAGLAEILLVTGSPLSPGAPAWATAPASPSPTFVGINPSTGANISNGIPAYWDGAFVVMAQNSSRVSIDQLDSSITIAADTSGQLPDYLIGGPRGWLARADGLSSTLVSEGSPPSEFAQESLLATWTNGTSAGAILNVARIAWATGGAYYLNEGTRLFRSESAAGPYVAVWDEYKSGGGNAQIRAFMDGVQVGGYLYTTNRWHFNDGEARYQIRKTPIDGFNFATSELLYDIPRGSGPAPVQLVVLEDETVVAYCDGGGLLTNANGAFEFVDTGLEGPSSLSGPETMPGGRRICRVGGLIFVIGYGVDGDKMVVVSDRGLTVSDPIPLPIQGARGIAVGLVNENLVPLPDAPGFYINRLTGEIVGPSGTQIDPCTPTNGSIVAAQCNSRGVASIDVSDLTDNVVGFRIASTSSPQKNIGALMPAYPFDSSEFDGVLHFPKRGGADSFDLTYDEFVERDGDPLQWERTQEPELLRKVTVGYMDPATSFSATTQQWERRAGTVKAEGEGTLQLPIVGTGDWAAQVCEKTGKIAWGESDKCTFHVSIQHAELVTAAVGTITDENGTKHRVRIERIEDEGLVRMVEARRTSAALYASTATGTQKPLPQYPGSGIHGPTISAVLNMPAILDADDRPGVYWAAAGYFPNWAGAQLQVQRAGTWTPLGTVLGPSSIGTLVSDLPAHHGDLDTVNTLHIRINDELENITFLQLLSERNAVALQYPDSTVEVVQFQSVEVDPDGNYLCTKLIRGNLNTVRGDHAAGATVVFIDQTMQFVDLRPDDLGRTLSFRVVGLGTDPDTSVPFDITFDRIWSSTEWPVAMFDVVKDGDDYQLTWIERRRLGTDVDPIRSANWEGYAVSYAYSGIANQITVTNPFHTFTLPGASDVDFTVAQLNRLTGEGPASEVNVP